MLTVAIDQAEPGMVLAAPVSHPEQPGQDLLKAGYVLETSVLGRLRDLGVDYIFINYPGLDDLDKHLAPQLSPERQRIYQQIRNTISANERNTRPTVSYHDYYAGTRALVLALMSQGQNPLYLDLMARCRHDLVGHSTAVAHLALLLGIKLERYLIQERQRLSPQHAREVVNIGVAGMLHDMGKLKLPDELRRHDGLHPPEDAQELKDWQHHARLGYELIHDGVEPSAANAVLHHHQRFDGTGFPATVHRDGSITRRAGSGIHVFARIVAAANLFDRLATPGRGQKRRMNFEILHLMDTQYAGWVDPEVLKVLKAVCPPFPPGMQVSLSDGTQAVVTRVDTAHPYRPTVRRMTENRRALVEESVDLSVSELPLAICAVGGRSVETFPPFAS